MWLFVWTNQNFLDFPHAHSFWIKFGHKLIQTPSPIVWYIILFIIWFSFWNTFDLTILLFSKVYQYKLKCCGESIFQYEIVSLRPVFGVVNSWNFIFHLVLRQHIILIVYILIRFIKLTTCTIRYTGFWSFLFLFICYRLRIFVSFSFPLECEQEQKGNQIN